MYVAHYFFLSLVQTWVFTSESLHFVDVFGANIHGPILKTEIRGATIIIGLERDVMEYYYGACMARTSMSVSSPLLPQ